MSARHAFGIVLSVLGAIGALWTIYEGYVVIRSDWGKTLILGTVIMLIALAIWAVVKIRAAIVAEARAK